jgi:hypothetical protein
LSGAGSVIIWLWPLFKVAAMIIATAMATTRAVGRDRRADRVVAAGRESPCRAARRREQVSLRSMVALRARLPASTAFS